MSLKQINEELSKIGRITSRWGDSPVSDIERELVLDKLKCLYEQVMFFERDLPEELPSDAGIAVPAAATAEELGEQAEEMLREFDQELSGPSEAGEAAAEVAEAVLAGQAEEKAKEAEEEKFPAGEGEDRPADGGGSDQPLFDMDEIVVRRRIDHRTILSLYGENCEIVKNESGRAEVRCERFVEKTQVEEPAASPEPAGEPVECVAGPEAARDAESFPETDVETLRPERETVVEAERTEPPVTLATGKSGAVLGEVIARGETLGDALARSAAHDDLASRVAATRTDELRKSIGINDKFLMIRDLFAGDAATYEEAITALDAFTDLDEAMLYLHDHYTGNPDSEGVKLLVELLVRKLS